MADQAVVALDLTQVLDQIRDGIDEAGRTINEIIAAVNSVLSQLPDIVVGAAREEIERMRRQFDLAVAAVQAAMSYAGSPAALRAAGSAWTRDVGARASAMAGFATLDAVRADDLWTGVAADGYRASLPPQNAALIAIKAASDEVDSVLQDVAAALDSFWAAVAGALVTMVAGLVASRVAAAGGPAGVAAGLAAAVGALVIFSLFLVSAMNSLTDLTNKVATGSAELDRRLVNDDAYRGGAWPRSTSDLSDGSLTDGDDTDWHIRAGS